MKPTMYMRVDSDQADTVLEDIVSPGSGVPPDKISLSGGQKNLGFL